MGWNTAGEHRFCLFPIFLDEHGKIDMSEETGNQSGREEAMKQSTIKDEVPPQTKKGEREDISKGLPDNESGQS